MKSKVILLMVALGLMLAACGVKNDLVRPDGKPNTRDTPDPSKPPFPVGR